MEKNDCYIGLELGSSSIKLVAGFVLNDQINILNTIEEECSGMENGLIVDQDQIIKTIKSVISNASKSLNLNIDEVCLCLPPYSLLCLADIGSTNTIGGDDIIKRIDISNILTAMKKRSLADNDLKIVDIVPDVYMLDNNDRYAIAPIGKTSKVLSLHASIYAMSEKVINQFVGCVKKANVNVKYTVIAPYAASLYLSTNKVIPNSYILVDIGHSLTTVAQISHETNVINSTIIKFGGHDITKAIAERFNISFDEAEELKQNYGIDHDMNFDTYILNDIKLNDLADVITKKLDVLIEQVDKTIKEFCTNNEQYPVVLTGGTSNLNNIKNYMSDALDLDVVDYPLLTIGARKFELINTLGLIKYWAIQPVINEDEVVTTTVSRVNQKPTRGYKFDEEL